MRRLALLPLLLLATACLPAIAHAPLTANPEDAFTCATRTLSSRGYTIVDEDVTGGVIHAQRDRHVAVPFRGTSDFDRIIVSIDRGRDPQMHARGDTIHEGGLTPNNAPHGGAFIAPMSREIYADTEAVVRNCAGNEG
ncbi:MAG TPA: hypothetical protein VF381_04130 [Thermoanaerobaculia bacterium]